MKLKQCITLLDHQHTQILYLPTLLLAYLVEYKNQIITISIYNPIGIYLM